MLKLPIIDGFNYNKANSYSDFVTNLEIEGTDFHNLGLASDGNPIYAISIGDLDGSKPIIFVNGALHGQHEWRSAHIVHHFMYLLANPPEYSYTINRLFEVLIKNFSFYTIICSNPYGYENDVRGNGQIFDLNRNFPYFWDEYEDEKGDAPLDQPESQIINNVWENLLPFIGVDFHINGYGLDDTWLIRTGNDNDNAYNALVRDMAETIKQTIGLDIDSFGNGGTLPSLRSYMASHNSLIHQKSMSIVFEPSYKHTEYEQAKIGLNALFIISLYGLSWYRFRTQELTMDNLYSLFN